MTTPIDPSFAELAHLKIETLLGEARGRALFDVVLREARLTEISDAVDLLDFGEALQKRGGVEGAVGSILRFQALLRGAKSRR